MPATTDAATDAVKTFETFTIDAQKAVTETADKAKKSFETVAAFNQETVDAMLKAQNIAAKAAEEIQAEVIAFSKKTVEETVAHAKELAAVQTVTDYVEKQAGFAKVTMDAMVRQTTRMNEMMAAAAKEAFAPLSARMAATADLMKTQNA